MLVKDTEDGADGKNELSEVSARLSVTERAPGVANYGKHFIFLTPFPFFNAANERRVLLSVIHVHLLRLVSYFVWDRRNADVLANT